MKLWKIFRQKKEPEVWITKLSEIPESSRHSIGNGGILITEWKGGAICLECEKKILWGHYIVCDVCKGIFCDSHAQKFGRHMYCCRCLKWRRDKEI
mgnify:FL=1